MPYRCSIPITILLLVIAVQTNAEGYISRIVEFPKEEIIQRKMDNNKSRLVFQPKLSDTLEVIQEDIYITLENNSFTAPKSFDQYRQNYSARYVYKIKNTGSDRVIPLGFFGRPYPQTGDNELPAVSYFKINGEEVGLKYEKVDYVAINPSIQLDGYSGDNNVLYYRNRIICWMYTDISFKYGEEKTIEISFVGDNFQGEYGNSISYTSYPYAIKPTKNATINMYLTNNTDLLKNNLYLSTILNFSQGFNLMDYLKKDILKNDIFSICKTSNNSWLLQLNSYFFIKDNQDFSGFDIILHEHCFDSAGARPFIRFNSHNGDRYVELPYENISETKLSNYELYLLTNDQLRMIRNSFYALNGYPFKDEDIRKYYTVLTEAWEYVSNQGYSDKLLKDIEKENIETIKKLEAEEKKAFMGK